MRTTHGRTAATDVRPTAAMLLLAFCVAASSALADEQQTGRLMAIIAAERKRSLKLRTALSEYACPPELRNTPMPRLPEVTNGGYCLTPYLPENLKLRKKKWASYGRHFRFDSNSTAKHLSLTISPGNPLAVGHYPADYGMVNHLAKFYEQGARILEVGAGQGQCKAQLCELRPDLRTTYHAFDGALNVEAYTKGLVGFHDACDPWPVEWDGSFDWLFTLEMVEHIPPACEPNFLDMLRSVPTKGIILSWDSRYEMVHHPNARTNVYVQEAIETLGYNFSDKLSTELRGSLDTFKDRTSNMFVFLKTKASVRK